MATQAIINVGAFDAQLTLNTPLPGAGQTATTGILDLSTGAPNSNAWRMGRIGIFFPTLPENTVAGGITVTLYAANASLTSSLPAPAAAVPGAFAQPAVSQVATLAGVAGVGTPATVLWMTLPFDSTGSTYEFVQFVISVTAGIITQNENLQISWVKDSP
jgi:hypothetical protein